MENKISENRQLHDSQKVMEGLVLLYNDAVTSKNYSLCDILRLEIKRCVMKKKYLIPGGQINGLLLDPKIMLGL